MSLRGAHGLNRSKSMASACVLEAADREKCKNLGSSNELVGMVLETIL